MDYRSRGNNAADYEAKKAAIIKTLTLSEGVQPGDWVLIRSWKEDSITPKWDGPYLVLITTDSAVRTAEKGWTHASRIKGPVDPTRFHTASRETSWKIDGKPGDLKLTVKRTYK
uniref:Murine leukemia virus integrase C-terminal domain-containing protein n=1 Tax=Taeniopygia guttata TaxID=59729 RepID=A0A674H4J6_TAEGU